MLEIVRAAFAARPPVDPPADALGETVESLEAALRHGGLVASTDGARRRRAGARPGGVHAVAAPRRRAAPRCASTASPRRWSPRPLAGAEGYDDVAVLAREELPGTVTFWREHGFAETGRHSPYVELRRRRARGVRHPRRGVDAGPRGARLASVLRPGDVVVLSGGLGAGKTTLTQGLGAGLGVRGDVTSPTFVIARVHPSLADGPALVHVDAYRIGGVAELDDLDLDTSLDEAVTVVEWGEGVAEGLADDRLEVRIERAVADEADAPELDPRRVRVSPVGGRWLGVRLSSLSP